MLRKHKGGKYMVKVKDLVGKYGNREVDEVELEKILKPEKVKTIYNLENEDKYYYISEIGICEWAFWTNNNFNKLQLAIGNIFLTKEDAEFEVEYLKVKAELKRYASMCEEPIDRSNAYQCKFYCSAAFDGMQFFNTNSIVGDNIYFTDILILEQAVQEIGEERIIKYYLGVKGENK